MRYLAVNRLERHINIIHEKFVAARFVDSFKDMISSDFPTGMSAEPYHRHVLVAKMILSLESVLTLMESLNGDDAV